MKITLQQTDTGEDEVILRYRQMTEQIGYIIGCIENSDRTLEGVWEGKRCRIRPAEVIYLESVDGVTWLLYAMDLMWRERLCSWGQPLLWQRLRQAGCGIAERIWRRRGARN